MYQKLERFDSFNEAVDYLVHHYICNYQDAARYIWANSKPMSKDTGLWIDTTKLFKGCYLDGHTRHSAEAHKIQ